MLTRTQKLQRTYASAKTPKDRDRFLSDLEEGFRQKHVKPDDYSLKELYEEFLPDGREVVRSWDTRKEGSKVSLLAVLQEADAVTTAAFSNITGQIVYNAVLEGFQSEAFTISGLIPTTPTAFSGEKIAGVAALGDLAEVIAEADPYPVVGTNEDWIQTPETVKRGMIVEVTREAIFFDRTGQLLNRCREVGEALGLNKEKRAIDCLIDENTTAHRYNRKNDGAVATYGNNSGTHDWDNFEASNALADWTDIDLAEQLLNAILDPNTGEPVVVMATHLIVAKGLEPTAKRILNATEIRQGDITTGDGIQTVSANPVNSYELVSSRFLAPRLAADTNWFLGDPRKAFTYMENFPLKVETAPVNNEREFTHDIAQRFKAGERGAYATIEPRAMVRNSATTA